MKTGLCRSIKGIDKLQELQPNGQHGACLQIQFSQGQSKVRSCIVRVPHCGQSCILFEALAEEVSFTRQPMALTSVVCYR